jgi:hypothetical protein
MFAARLLLGEFVTGYEVSGWYGVGAPKGTPVELKSDPTEWAAQAAWPWVRAKLSD